MIGQLVHALGTDRSVQVTCAIISVAISAVVLLATRSLGWSSLPMSVLAIVLGLCRMQHEGKLR